MKKLIFVLLLIFSYTQLYTPAYTQAIKCFKPPITFDLSLSWENYMQERHNRISDFPGFGSVDIIAGIEYKDWIYSTGIGYAWDEEIIGYNVMEFDRMTLVNTLYVDSTYWVGNQMYIYHEEIKIYDSIKVMIPILVNTKYQYTKIPIEIKRRVYRYWDIDIYAKFKGNMFYEITRKIEYQGSEELPKDFTYMLEPRKKKFYILGGLGVESAWDIVKYKRNSTIKSTSIIKKITIFGSFMVYYQPEKFQPIYKPLYISFNLGVRLFSF